MVGMYYLTAVCLFFLNREFRAYIRVRQRYLQQRKAHMRTIMLDVPPDARSNAILESYFGYLYPDSVLTAVCTQVRCCCCLFFYFFVFFPSLFLFFLLFLFFIFYLLSCSFLLLIVINCCVNPADCFFFRFCFHVLTLFIPQFVLVVVFWAIRGKKNRSIPSPSDSCLDQGLLLYRDWLPAVFVLLLFLFGKDKTNRFTV